MGQPDPNYIRMIEDSKTIERLGSERNALLEALRDIEATAVKQTQEWERITLCARAAIEAVD